MRERDSKRSTDHTRLQLDTRLRARTCTLSRLVVRNKQQTARFSTQMEEAVGKNWIRQCCTGYAARLSVGALLVGGSMVVLNGQSFAEDQGLQVKVNQADGTYAVALPGADSYAMRAGVAAQVDGRWLHASDYP